MTNHKLYSNDFLETLKQLADNSVGIACAKKRRNFIGVELDFVKANLGGAGEIISPNPLPVKAEPKLQLSMF